MSNRNRSQLYIQVKRSFVVTSLVTFALTAIVQGSPLQTTAGTGKKSAPANHKSDVSVTFSSKPSPPKTGDNTFEVTLKSADGKPVTDADVTVTFFMAGMPSMNMPEMKNSVALKHQGDGRYTGTGHVTMAGKWDVTVVAKREGKQIASKKLTVNAR